MIIPVLGKLLYRHHILKKLEYSFCPLTSWGNSQLNTTTKPLFEETLQIVFECFEKHKKGRSILPIECLKNYELIYNENDDKHILSDDNQVFSERTPLRPLTKDSLPYRSNWIRTLSSVNATRASSTVTKSNNSDILPLTSEKIAKLNSNSNSNKKTNFATFSIKIFSKFHYNYG